MEEIHLTKKDFKIDWFSGTGNGGQNRNRHQNNCRITHLESGLQSIGSEKERITNIRTAFNNLSKKIIAYYKMKETKSVIKTDEVIRNYNKNRNQVLDKATGFQQPWTEVVDKGDLGEMIDKRRSFMETNEKLTKKED